MGFMSVGKNFKKLLVYSTLACMSFVPSSYADQRIERPPVKESWNTLAGYQDREKQEKSWHSIQDQQSMIFQPENHKDLDTKNDAQSFYIAYLSMYIFTLGVVLLSMAWAYELLR